MTRMIFGKVMWVGRATVFLVGFAVMLALVSGAASAAFGADTDFFRLGRSNFAESITRLIKSGGGPALSLQVDSGPPLPSSLYGKSMLLTGMEICYNTSDAAVALSRVKLLRYSSTGVLPTGGNFVVDDSTPADGNQCRMYSGTPQLMGTNSFAFLEMHVNWSETTSQTSFVIERTTFFLKPSNAPAAPL